MGHRPVVVEDYGLIVYNATNRTQVQKYIDNIDEFLAPYNNKSLLINGGTNQRDCGVVKPPRKEVCSFNTKLLGPCNRENDYGYSNMTPCLIIKLNKVGSINSRLRENLCPAEDVYWVEDDDNISILFVKLKLTRIHFSIPCFADIRLHTDFLQRLEQPALQHASRHHRVHQLHHLAAAGQPGLEIR